MPASRLAPASPRVRRATPRRFFPGPRCARRPRDRLPACRPLARWRRRGRRDCRWRHQAAAQAARRRAEPPASPAASRPRSPAPRRPRRTPARRSRVRQAGAAARRPAAPRRRPPRQKFPAEASPVRSLSSGSLGDLGRGLGTRLGCCLGGTLRLRSTLRSPRGRWSAARASAGPNPAAIQCPRACHRPSQRFP